MRIITLMFKTILAGTVISVIGITGVYLYFASNLPKLSSMADYQPPLVTRIYSTDGELLAEYADEHRILTPLEDIPQQLRNAFLAAEDEHFYQHPGVNPARILSAAIANLKAGHTVQGGSTITQQVAKNFLLSSERSYTRKIRELILAQRIEDDFSKDEILYLYLNQIYLGRGAYGVASAAWRYFGKRLDELTLAECAMLAGLPKAPGYYAPHLRSELSVQRRNLVLNMMKTGGFADEEAVNQAQQEALSLAELPANRLTNAYANMVYQQLLERFGRTTLRKQGLSIVIPYDWQAEDAAVHAVRTGILNLEQRQPYRIPTYHDADAWTELLSTWAEQRQGEEERVLGDDEIIPALVELVLSDGDLLVMDGINEWQISKPKWRWEKPEAEPEQQPQNNEDETVAFKHPQTWIAGDEVWLQGDGKGGVRLTQQPSLESSLYSIDLQKGTVLARVGGFDFKLGDFDRVDSANRQPGSAFKPFLYETAMQAGYTPASIIMDSPVVFENLKKDEFWRPENYKNKFSGAVTLRDALEHSRNLASIKLLQDIGINRFTQALNDNYLFNRKFPAQLALALGVTEVTLKELTESYAVIASGGMRWEPVSIQQIQDRNGNTLHRSVAGHRCQTCHADPILAINKAMQPAEQTLDPVNAFLATNMMHGVILHGTGRRALALKRPAAGKTGTTNNQVDAWFMGYTPQVLTGVWTGRDIPAPMGRRETGAGAALPTWLSAMQSFHRNRPKLNFAPPDGIEWVAIDSQTGLLPGSDSKRTFLESFRIGSAPNEASPTSPRNSAPTQKKDFFDMGL